MILILLELDSNESAQPLVVNSRERSRLAHEYANHFTGRHRNNIFYRRLFDSDLVKHDTPEPQARELIEHLETRGARIIYLTSRPHTMKNTTEQWLSEHHLLRPCVFKYYGTDEKDPDGQIDTGDRFMKTSA
ncbi:hypothetical protein EI42_04386 [Thermosporothrix hazakensis]|jgi:acid phosphatase class B|uniref:Uncharacterized protein n=2 Tax=Thermosporothrix hazakensis TaxID=644383 RepID=A0A326U1Z6_THEHA|nr:hypothetical protein EI42_04386 [Thermosporothrix hazakensis]GCE50565.1 hypothetical protein KTH_54340 [Thermosporothrix hazakensis]